VTQSIKAFRYLLKEAVESMKVQQQIPYTGCNNRKCFLVGHLSSF